jgi:hypothetical protein
MSSPTSPYCLVVGLLTTRSSYIEATEEPHDGIPDTVQFWFTPNHDWRIQTFAIDHDIHVYQIRDAGSERTIDSGFAEASIQKNYGDVLDRIVVLDLKDPADEVAVADALRRAELAGVLKQSQSGVAFYNPDGVRYRTQSEPS